MRCLRPAEKINAESSRTRHTFALCCREGGNPRGGEAGGLRSLGKESPQPRFVGEVSISRKRGHQLAQPISRATEPMRKHQIVPALLQNPGVIGYRPRPMSDVFGDLHARLQLARARIRDVVVNTLGLRLAFAGRAREISGSRNRPYAPSARIDRNPFSTSTPSAVSQTPRSRPQRRCTCSGVKERPGISRYSARCVASTWKGLALLRLQKT